MAFCDNKGKIYIISGPSGCGKGTIVHELLKDEKNKFSISMTTRKIRDGEIDGVHYYFVSKEKFEEEIKNGGLLEYARTYENYYGTPKKPALENLNNGFNVILDIEMQGALQVKENYPDSVSIFLLPPSLEELRKRLIGRGTETLEQVDIRLSNTLKEFEYIEKYDYYVINDEINSAVDKVKAIIKAEESKVNFSSKEVIDIYNK